MVQSLGPAGEQLKLPFISAKGRQTLYFQILLPSFFFPLSLCLFIACAKDQTSTCPLFSAPNGGGHREGSHVPGPSSRAWPLGSA